MPAPPLDDAQKEAIRAISAITVQLITIAVAVFSLVGTAMARRDGELGIVRREILLWIGLTLLALSVLAGYTVHGAIIGQLEDRTFTPYDAETRWTGLIQFMLFVSGAMMCAVAVLRRAGRVGILLRLDAPDADAVTLVGSFNNWGYVGDIRPFRLRRRSSGWQLRITLPPGEHRYLFLVETPGGRAWVADPLNPHREPNAYGGHDCIVRIPGGKA